ncbi:lytic transglycosylase domain-containing protein [Sphingomonas sanguinis]|uniref:Lytic transglycosylase n=1 Tax=Sphingomonas sanguinis TaxID=33051 RepID=A0A147IMX3_9SPHN|nr:lytic transglycosylase domain-containing protein [Sphingomonas sanguinis]KTT96645.1 lytic transglycosylase [Sphingomonas sanguinis]
MHTIVLRTAAALLTGIATAAPILPAGAQTSRAVRAILVDPYAGHIAEASQRFGIPAAWIRAVMRAESAGDPRAVSHAGAIGLMQVMPATWADLRVRHRLGADPYDPRDNILAGTAYLRELHDRYGSVVAMLAAYNAGPGRYEASLAGRSLPAETRAYVAAIVPIVDGGATVTPVVVTVADTLAWTRAPLFIAQPDRHSAADPVSAERPSNEAGPPPSVRDASAMMPQSAGLFVARVGTGTTR